jgi:tetratricopeptide (TPR) repeat protein
MRKETYSDKVGNVIQFPDLEKRLLEKGQEYLQQEKFREAIDVFQQAVKLDSSNSDGYLGLLLAFYGAGTYEEAVEIAKVMLNEGMGDYFPIMDLYIKLLFQAHQYAEIVTVIEGLLEEKTIPSERLEHYYSMLDISRQMELGDEIEAEESLLFEELDKELCLQDYTNQQDQLMLAAKLAKVNIQPYIKEMMSYLRDDSEKEGDFFFKTLLLNVLKEHGVEQTVEIHKFGKAMSIIPKNLTDVNDIPQLQEIVSLIAGRIEHDDPILFESITMLIHRQFFLSYPFPLEGPKLSAWAAAFHVLGLEYFGNDCIKRDVLEEYQVQEAEFDIADSFIRMIEKKSYPNI